MLGERRDCARSHQSARARAHHTVCVSRSKAASSHHTHSVACSCPDTRMANCPPPPHKDSLHVLHACCTRFRNQCSERGRPRSLIESETAWCRVLALVLACLLSRVWRCQRHGAVDEERALVSLSPLLSVPPESSASCCVLWSLRPALQDDARARVARSACTTRASCEGHTARHCFPPLRP